MLSKEAISSALWNMPRSREIEKRIRQTIFVIRGALGKDAIKTGLNEGYGLVLESSNSRPCEEPDAFRRSAYGFKRHYGFAIVESGLFSLSCAIPLFIETAYQRDVWWNGMGLAGMLVLGLSFSFALSAFVITDATVGRWKPSTSLIAGLGFVVISGLVICSVGLQVLPDVPITETYFFQAQTAQFAFAKSICVYSLPVFMAAVLVPYRSIISVEGLSFQQDLEDAYAYEESIYRLDVRILVLLLAVFSIYSVFTTSYLLENLRPSENQNIYSFLLLARNATYFLIAIIGIWWYYENQSRSASSQPT